MMIGGYFMSQIVIHALALITSIY